MGVKANKTLSGISRGDEWTLEARKAAAEARAAKRGNEPAKPRGNKNFGNDRAEALAYFRAQAGEHEASSSPKK